MVVIIWCGEASGGLRVPKAIIRDAVATTVAIPVTDHKPVDKLRERPAGGACGEASRPLRALGAAAAPPEPKTSF